MAEVLRSYRCSRCDHNWPTFQTYHPKCPLCGDETWATDMPAMSATDAQQVVTKHNRRVAAHEKFEQYYEEREVRTLNAELDSQVW